MAKKDSSLVWSSEQGDLRKQQNQKTMVTQSLPPQQQTVYLHRESKGRGGKGVIIVKGLVLSPADLTALAKTLKQACGSGGTIKEGAIELQGQEREKVSEVLKNLGYKVKLAGG
jgi:translation initiation factor 1